MCVCVRVCACVRARVCVMHIYIYIYAQASKKSVLVCDIQGVGDLYTDPQIHSSDGGGCVRVIGFISLMLRMLQ